MINIIKGTEPKSLKDERLRIQKELGRDTTKADFEDKFSGNEELKKSLLGEQGYLCCYCMGQITEDNMRVEHFLPKGKDKQGNEQFPQLALTYENLLAACSGGEQSGKKNDTSRHYCDVKKKSSQLNVLPNPSDKSSNYENIITYSSKGEIQGNKAIEEEKQKLLSQDINDILNLNIDFLVQNRVQARQTVISIIHKKTKDGIWKKVSKQIIQKYHPGKKGKKAPYCGYIYFWLKKRFKLQN